MNQADNGSHLRRFSIGIDNCMRFPAYSFRKDLPTWYPREVLTTSISEVHREMTNKGKPPMG